MSTTHKQLEQVESLAQRLMAVCKEQESHRVALDALIAAYTTLAIYPPCCADYAASQARDIADYIDAKAPTEGTQHVH
jgi:hypothetical protein